MKREAAEDEGEREAKTRSWVCKTWAAISGDDTTNVGTQPICKDRMGP